MKLLHNLAILFFSVNASAEAIKLNSGEMFWKNPKSKTEISLHKLSDNSNHIYYTPRCIFICYTGCKSNPAPIEGKEVALTPWWDPSNSLFQKLPEPFDSYRILVAQAYGGAIGGEENYMVQVNISNDEGMLLYKESSTSLDKMQISGKVTYDVDLEIEPDIFLRAECSYTRTR